jgi:hypothetical protein
MLANYLASLPLTAINGDYSYSSKIIAIWTLGPGPSANYLASLSLTATNSDCFIITIIHILAGLPTTKRRVIYILTKGTGFMYKGPDSTI